MIFSIVVPVNNIVIFNENIKASLKKQKMRNFELVMIDTIKHGFSSASQALNSVRNCLHGDYIIFAHQDINFLEENFLETLYKFCMEYEFGIAGVVGKVKLYGKYEIATNIVHTIKKINAGSYSGFSEVIETENLDECFFIIPNKILKKYAFGDLGNTWHLYATEYCLQMKKNNYKSYIFPLHLWHNCKSNSLDKDYFYRIRLLCKKYRKYKKITTIYGVWPTLSWLCYLKCAYRSHNI